MLAAALEYLRTEVRPRAEEIDQSSDALRNAYRGLCDRGLMAMRISPEISASDFQTFQIEVARASGTLAFLQTQHQSAVGLLSRVKEFPLEGFADGTHRVGIGFSQLRRPGPPIMAATPVDGGYLLQGHVPWITGWDFYERFILGAALPNGESLFALLPLHSGPGIEISAPMKLAAMGTANTVTAEISGYFLPSDQVAFIKEPGWIAKNDNFNITLQAQFSIGCAFAGIDVVRDNFAFRKHAFLAETADALTAELDLVVQELAVSTASEDRLAARANAIDVMMRAAQSAVLSSSGAANMLTHPAQRIYREALVFSVSAQTTDIMRASLARLTQ